jgi:hypothetical protein
MQYVDLKPTVERLLQYRDDLLSYVTVQTNTGTVEAV